MHWRGLGLDGLQRNVDWLGLRLHSHAVQAVLKPLPGASEDCFVSKLSRGVKRCVVEFPLEVKDLGDLAFVWADFGMVTSLGEAVGRALEGSGVRHG